HLADRPGPRADEQRLHDQPAHQQPGRAPDLEQVRRLLACVPHARGGTDQPREGLKMQSKSGTKNQRQRLNRIRRIMPAIAAASAAVVAARNVTAASATWSFLGSGAWSTTSNWAGGNPADGAASTADFSKLNITADQTVSL